jgi:transcriptional regulator with XRE-family HTH domain
MGYKARMQGRAGRLIRKTRLEKGYTLKDVTMATGLEQSLLSRWERAAAMKVAGDSLFVLCRFLEIDFNEIGALLIEDADNAKRAKEDASAARAARAKRPPVVRDPSAAEVAAARARGEAESERRKSRSRRRQAE